MSSGHKVIKISWDLVGKGKDLDYSGQSLDFIRRLNRELLKVSR